MLPPSFHKEDNMNTENIIDIAINFNDPEWILKHITIALQRTSDADFVKRPCGAGALCYTRAQRLL